MLLQAEKLVNDSEWEESENSPRLGMSSGTTNNFYLCSPDELDHSAWVLHEPSMRDWPLFQSSMQSFHEGLIVVRQLFLQLITLFEGICALVYRPRAMNWGSYHPVIRHLRHQFSTGTGTTRIHLNRLWVHSLNYLVSGVYMVCSSYGSKN